jgi:predicted enzyme related to lactoylglutathione lyase
VAIPASASAWLGYFTVDHVDAACATARKHGGRVVVEPFGAPPGRIARLADPGGAPAV